ncbi:MAG: hypothetical protein ACHQ7N_12580 [Candidatus Methylomirabilales bacterium]
MDAGRFAFVRGRLRGVFHGAQEDGLAEGLVAALVKTMTQWQGVEDESIKMSKEVQAKTENPLVRLVMEMLAHDSAMHRRVQQFIIDFVEKAAFTLTPEEPEAIWSQIDKHIEAERKTIELAEQARASS